MALSILHRATGAALYAGTLLLLAWLWAAALGAEAYALVQTHSGAWYGQSILFAYSWALFHHLFGGLRHFIWDFGRGFELNHVEILARLSALMPLILTLLTWGIIYKIGGGI